MKVVVTGAGGAAAVCIIKDLARRHDVVAVDADRLASGLYLSQRSYLVPPIDNGESVVDRVLDIAKREGASLVIPTVSEELIHFARSTSRFLSVGVTVVVSNPRSIEIANDKSSLYDFLKNEGYCPKVYADGEGIEFPCVVKPAVSRGSRGFYVCESEKAMWFAVERNAATFGKSVVMEYLEGPEYSVYGISDLKGVPKFAVAIERVHATSESKKARVNNDGDVLAVAKDIASALNLAGPWNVQIIKTRRGPKVVEVNPRFAGTLSLPIAAGANLVELAIGVFLGREIDWEKVGVRDGLIMTRYNEEVFIEPDGVVTW